MKEINLINIMWNFLEARYQQNLNSIMILQARKIKYTL